MNKVTLPAPDRLCLEAVWESFTTTVRQRLIEELIRLAIRRLPQELIEPQPKEVL
jgi:hypothetical protein